jgi:hypothetical protein
MTDHPGQRFLDSQTSDFHAQNYMIEEMLSRMSKATLASVQSVTTTGAVAAVGSVSLLPLVNMQDSYGNAHKHTAINNIPYFRYQGGNKAIILDPKVGDIGVAVFADRDISSVKKNKKQSNAGSFRRHDMADGLFFPCFLGATPTSYIQFQDDGTLVFSPDNGTTLITVKAGKITLTVSGTTITLQSGRVDLGGLGGAGVQTAAGTSGTVFAIL